MMIHQSLVALLVCVGWGSMLLAQPTTAPSVSTEPPPRFESLSAGISLQPLAGMKVIRGSSGSNEVARFLDESRRWVMILTRVELDLDKPVPLTTWKDPKTKTDQPGMLQMAIEQFKAITPGAQILKEDADTTGKLQIGYMAAKYNLGMETTLAQEAVVRATDHRYFLMTLAVPAPRSGELEDDKGIRDAVDGFKQIVDSIEMVDQSTIRQDQEDRLFRTRSLYLSLSEKKLRAALVHEQWFRFIEDGKDVGYSYIVQEVARDLPRKGGPEVVNGPEGVLIGVRSRLMPQPGTQTDALTWYFSTFDRRYEAFSSVVYADDSKRGKSTSGEVGVSRKREKPVAVNAGGGAVGPKMEVIPVEEYRLEVTRIGANVAAEPVVRDLPPFYLPLAIHQLLPGMLMPSKEPKTYLFASWVTDVGQVMYRYVDVGMEAEVTLAGKRVRATPVKDRVGLEGSITTHYVSPEGKYLGSVNEDSKTTILASDAAALEKLWKDVNLTRPSAVETK